MKNKTILVLALGGAFISPLTAAFAQGSAITYHQGRLNDGANLANGSYDLRFAIFDAASAGTPQGNLLTNSATAMSNGLFTVTLDFGNQFPGANRWLEIAVRTNGAANFFTLNPRQALTPAPYAITAGNVISGGLATGTYGNAVTLNNANNSFNGSFSGNGASVTNVNAVTLGGIHSSNFWNTAGNSGTAPGANFLGTVDNQPLVVRANNLQVMKFAYASNAVSGYSPNVIGGNSANNVSAGVVGGTIGGGGVASPSGSNSVSADFGTVVGGFGCNAGGKSAIAGGIFSRAGGQFSVAFGGGSLASSDFAVAMGNSAASGTNATAFGNSSATTNYAFAAGNQSVASGNASTAMGSSSANGIGSTAMGSSAAFGGYSTAMGSSSANGDYSTALGNSLAFGLDSIAMGASTAVGDYSLAAGAEALAYHQGAFVWADSQFVPFSSSANDQFLIRAQGGVGIGLTNPAAALHVASASGTPQFRITQQNATDYTRLRMNVASYPSWEMDVSPGATPSISWWTGTLRMNLDYNGNLTTSGTVNGTSDRNAKEKFTPVSSSAVLDKVAALPITEWNFKNESTIRHIGPMAQDFYAAFTVGMDDKHIATVDEGGVALAAIKGLNEKLETRSQRLESENATLKLQNESLEKRLETLEQIILQQKTK